jgi:perosamine synthetase
MMEKREQRIYVSEPSINEDDVEAVASCVRSGWVSGISGWVQKFEEAFAKYCGTKYGIACNSGSTTLLIALRAIQHSYPDYQGEVILPAFTMVACANAVVYANMTPVFADCDPETWCMQGGDMEPHINDYTRAVMPVHIYGHPADMQGINYLAKREGLVVVEDAAEAHGATYYGKRAGALGDIGSFSFYANKIMTTGEGGILTTDNEALANRMQWLKAQAFGRESHFWHEDFGYNFRMSGMQAALGRSQLERLDELVATRRRCGKLYTEALEDIDDITLPIEQPNCTNVYWMYSIVLPDNVNRNKVMAILDQQYNIETRPMFSPLHLQPIYRYLGYVQGDFPISEWLGDQGMNLPSSTSLTPDDIEYIASTLKQVLVSGDAK